MSTHFRVARTLPRFVASAPVTNTYATEVLADSPLAYYRQGEASGSTMFDSSGNGSRDGTYFNSPTLGVSGLLTSGTDTAVTYNGTTQYGENSFSSWMNVSTVTIEAIIKTTTTSGTVFGRGGSNRNYRLGVSAGKAFIEVSVGGTFPFLASSSLVNDGNPHHIAGTWDGSTSTIYVDGVSRGTLSASGGLSTAGNPLRVAARSGDSFFAGTVEECALYGTALSSTRIAAHAAAR